MGAQIVIRAAWLIVSLIAASIVVFAVTNVLPGDVAAVILGTSATPEALDTLRRQLGLDQPAWTRYVRSAIVDVQREDFIRTARAKGLTRWQALRRHGFRYAAIPVVTILGIQLTGLLVGAIVIENVFVLPGLGRLLFQSVGNRDLIVVQDLVMLLTAVVLVVNFLVDLSYRLIDPRIRSSA